MHQAALKLIIAGGDILPPGDAAFVADERKRSDPLRNIRRGTGSMVRFNEERFRPAFVFGDHRQEANPTLKDRQAHLGSLSIEP